MSTTNWIALIALVVGVAGVIISAAQYFKPEAPIVIKPNPSVDITPDPIAPRKNNYKEDVQYYEDQIEEGIDYYDRDKMIDAIVTFESIMENAPTKKLRKSAEKWLALSNEKDQKIEFFKLLNEGQKDLRKGYPEAAIVFFDAAFDMAKNLEQEQLAELGLGISYLKIGKDFLRYDEIYDACENFEKSCDNGNEYGCGDLATYCN